MARRYAEALIGAAEKEGGVEPLLDELAEIEARRPEAVPAVRRDPGLGQGLVGRERPDPDRRLRRAAPRAWSCGSCGSSIATSGSDLLAVVAREARAIWDRRNRRIPVQVRSAVPLDEDQLQALRDRLARLTGAHADPDGLDRPGSDRRPGRPGR